MVFLYHLKKPPSDINRQSSFKEGYLTAAHKDFRHFRLQCSVRVLCNGKWVETRSKQLVGSRVHDFSLSNNVIDRTKRSIVLSVSPVNLQIISLVAITESTSNKFLGVFHVRFSIFNAKFVKYVKFYTNPMIFIFLQWVIVEKIEYPWCVLKIIFNTRFGSSEGAFFKAHLKRKLLYNHAY